MSSHFEIRLTYQSHLKAVEYSDHNHIFLQYHQDMNFITSAYCILSLFFALTPSGNTHASPAIEKKITIIALGDSITDGYGIDKNKAYPQLTQDLLTKEGRKIEIINAGVSGSTSASGASRLKWFLKRKPDILFLALGANDGLRGVALNSTKKNLKDTIALAKKNSIRVWLAGMKMPPNYGENYTAGFVKMYQEIATEEKTPLFPFLLEGVAGHAELNQADGIHPNEAGHKIIATSIAKFIRDNL